MAAVTKVFCQGESGNTGGILDSSEIHIQYPNISQASKIYARTHPKWELGDVSDAPVWLSLPAPLGISP